MRHSIRQAEHRPELEGIDPVMLFVVPLAVLLLGLIAIRAIVAAIVV